MKIFNSINDWQAFRKGAVFNDKSIGFIPTMGNLHQGHRMLLQRSVAENQLSVLSIYVNPSQFDDPADLQHYPRTLEQDLVMAENAGVDFVILPEYAQIYPDNYRYKVSETDFSQLLCGKSRAGHFDGVLTIVLKLLLLVKAQKAYFGEKDYQQLQLVRDMCQAFFIDTTIVPCFTVREATGLALSSRNNRLTPVERSVAPEFYRLLSSDLSLPDIRQRLAAKGFEIDYIEEYDGRRFGAVITGSVRLIDNVPLTETVSFATKPDEEISL